MLPSAVVTDAAKTFGANFLRQIEAKYLSKRDQVTVLLPRPLLNSLPQDSHQEEHEFCWALKAPKPQTTPQGAAGKLRGIW